MTQETLRRAVALHQGGRLAEAEGLYRQALADGGGDAQAHFLFALSLHQQSRPAEALAAAGAALARDPGHPDALMLRAMLRQAAGQAEAALDDLAALTRHAPGHAQAWFNQGVMLSELSRPAEAVAAFDRALALAPSAMAWSGRGAAQRALGQLPEALDSFARAAALDPHLVPARYNHALTLHDLGRHAEALAGIDALLATEPRLAPALFTRGALLRTLGRHADALAAYDAALAVAPDPDAHLGRAYALGPLGRIEEVLAACDAALALAPDHVEALRRRAVALHTLQRFDEARASVERALALAPDDLAARRTLGRIHAEAGRIAEAMQVFADRAALAFANPAAAPLDGPGDPEPKRRHDREQAAWLATQGVDLAALPPPAFRLEGGARIDGPAVNPANTERAAAAWAASDPKILVVDDLLTPPALEALRRFCWGSTVWRKPYTEGYLGAFDYDGFACPLLAQIAEELGQVLPTVIDGHGLLGAWAFKYDSTLDGIRIHADQAAINVNFWITPDEANRDPAHGGMVVWDKVAPPDWEITQYNGDDAALRAFLADAGAQAVTVPYRANRAVIFDSDLFHETDGVDFEPGYLNRRINVTMLYGRRNFLNR